MHRDQQRVGLHGQRDHLSYTFTAISGPAATISPKVGGSAFGTTVACPNAFINCTFSSKRYRAGCDEWRSGNLHWTREPLERSGGFCPSEIVLGRHIRHH